MHLVAFLTIGPTYHHHGMWRHPATENRFLEPAWWESVGRTLEKAKFDACFFADSQSFSSDVVLERGGQLWLLDPLPLASMMARATSHLGIGITVSTSLQEPYGIARALGSLDVLSGGRVAWNVVTTANNREAENYGMTALPPRTARYDRADEVLEACFRLWDSFGAGALIVDKASGRFADPAKFESFDYQGQWVRTKGPLTVPRSPQGRPVIMQAGASERGREFAARWAEVIFTLQHSLADMKLFYADIKGRMQRRGRLPEDCAILTSVDPIVGETEAIAREKRDYVNSLVDAELAIELVSAHTGQDLSAYPPDQPLADLKLETGSRGSLEVILQGTKAENLTLREAARRFATSELCPQIVGTPEQVADELQLMFEHDGCDGFILTPTVMPGSFEDFARSVVPILQERGQFRREYPGTTLRDTLRS
jgi:FMN-dependent oxidoreductase (nitrilotriacetate monooxygenase family)